jgi:macrolide-specific efflux system membrane fusion protein
LVQGDTVRTFVSGIRTRTWVILSSAVAALLVAALVLWFVFVQPSETDAQQETRTQTVTASLTTLEQSVSGTGTLTPSVQESVSFETSGTVTAVTVAEGDIVTAGQVLATIDDLAVTESLLSAQADLATAEARLAESRESSSGSDADVATIAADAAAVSIAEAAVASAEEDMADVQLIATVAGTVTAVDLAVGDVVGSSSGSSTGVSAATSSEGSTLDAGAAQSTATEAASSSGSITIVATDAWTTTVSLSAADVQNIAVGNEAELTVDGVDEIVAGTVTAVGLLPSTESGAALFPVTITTSGAVDGLYDGLSATVAVVYERREDVLAVPSAAITTTDGVSTVTRIDENGDEVDVEVTVGETADTFTEILSGLVEGDEVVMTVVAPGGGGTQTDDGSGTEQQGQFPGGGEMPEGFEPPTGFTGGQNE